MFTQPETIKALTDNIRFETWELDQNDEETILNFIFQISTFT